METNQIAIHFSGRNFMTPNIIKYGQKNNYIYEVSSGKGLRNEIIYGFTVKVKVRGYYIDSDYSKCCFSTAEIEECIQAL